LTSDTIHRTGHNRLVRIVATWSATVSNSCLRRVKLSCACAARQTFTNYKKVESKINKIETSNSKESSKKVVLHQMGIVLQSDAVVCDDDSFTK
jgi:hypothetical protein